MNTVLEDTLVAESVALRGTAVAAARGVADQLRRAFRTQMQVDFKRDMHDIVTVHDKAAEKSIVARILDEVPDSVIIGEEGGTRGEGRVTWYIDPIDGTSNFARGIALWCVSIAAAIDTRVVAGVVYDPVADNLFSADLTGAWRNDQPLHAVASPVEAGATIVSSFPAAIDVKMFGDDALQAHRLLLENFQAVRNLGSGALNLAHVAAGWADATMGFATSPWDVAAGILILHQAGGRYRGYVQGDPYTPLQHAEDYFAVGRDAQYPTLESVIETLSRTRRSVD
ncbi:inositol monophosphatase family protein [Microbacterium protaetiae]|uniref:inositol monophosphatase family protein n=1 Tax=Microbacterium protaetiae TaxID=2509458 RepID=UPI001A933C56|nr:inositol monophosphatase family protein [Microbacterium protaetiae]